VWAGWSNGLTEPSCPPRSLSAGGHLHGARGDRLLEAHLLDSNDDLYGEVLTVLLVRNLREQQAYDSSSR